MILKMWLVALGRKVWSPMGREYHTHPRHTHSDMKHIKHLAQEEKYTGCLEIGGGKTVHFTLDSLITQTAQSWFSCIMFVATSSVHHFIAILSKAFFCLSFRRPHPISISQIKPDLLAFPFAILLQTYSSSHNSQCV